MGSSNSKEEKTKTKAHLDTSMDTGITLTAVPGGTYIRQPQRIAYLSPMDTDDDDIKFIAPRTIKQEINQFMENASLMDSFNRISVGSQSWTTMKSFSKRLGTLGAIISALDVGHTVVITYRNSESMDDFISTIPSILWEHKLDLLNIAMVLCPISFSALKEFVLTKVVEFLPSWNIFSQLRHLFQPGLRGSPLPYFLSPSSGSMLKGLSEFEMAVGKHFMSQSVCSKIPVLLNQANPLRYLLTGKLF